MISVRGGLLAHMVEEDDIFKIGFILILLTIASALVMWDPNSILPGYEKQQSKVQPYSEEENLEISVNATFIDWGMLEPGGYSERVLLIENIGEAPGILSISAGNFTPVEAEQFMNLSWSVDPLFSLEPGKNVEAFLRLEASILTTGFREFSFNIMIMISSKPKI